MKNVMATRPQRIPELVVLVHGIGAKRLVMEPLRYRLKRYGFRVEAWRYRSLVGSIEHHAEHLYRHLLYSFAEESTIHIVAHSMGCIVTRASLAIGPIANLGRLVFLAPPNSGTPVARYADKWTGGFLAPLNALSDSPNSVARSLPTVGPVDVGILAARFDMLIPLANTHLLGERDHRVLNATHNSLLLSKTAARLTLSFLASGRFEPSDNPVEAIVTRDPPRTT